MVSACRGRLPIPDKPSNYRFLLAPSSFRCNVLVSASSSLVIIKVNCPVTEIPLFAHKALNSFLSSSLSLRLIVAIILILHILQTVSSTILLTQNTNQGSWSGYLSGSTVKSSTMLLILASPPLPSKDSLMSFIFLSIKVTLTLP